MSTAILLFTKTNSGGTDQVWFYDLQADGWSLDDKRQPLLAEDKLGAVPETSLSEAEHAKNNLPDVLRRWRTLHPLSLPLPLAGEGWGRDGDFEPHAASPSSGIGLQADARTASEGVVAHEPSSRYSEELARPRTAQSFCVPRADIEANGYDLSLNRYKEVVHGVIQYRAPVDILAELERLEGEIQQGMKELLEMVR